MSRARLAVLLGALWATSCGAPLMKLPTGPGLPVADAVTVLEQATSACAGVTSFSAEVGVSGSVHGDRARGRLLVGLAVPASFYIEAPAPFGAPLFVLAAAGDEGTLLLPRDHRVLEHGRPAEILEAIAGVSLGADDLRATLTGCPPPGAVASADARAFGNDWRRLSFARGSLYLQRQPASGPWRLVSVAYDGADGWQADFSDFANDLPRRVRLRSSTPRRFDLRLDLSQVDVHASLDSATLHVTIPPGTQPITIEELRTGGPLSR